MTHSPDNQSSSVIDRVSKAIDDKRIHMRPRIYFILGSVLLGVGIVAALVVAVFFFGVVIFRFRVNGPLLLQWGTAAGYRPFFEAIPWLPILIAVLGITAGILLLRRYRLSYRHAVAGIAAGVAVAAVVLGIVTDTTGIPEAAENVRIFQPFVHHRYEGSGWVVGVVDKVDDPTIDIRYPDGIIVLTITNETVIRPDAPIMTGEIVRALGEREDGQIKAEWIDHGLAPFHRSMGRPAGPRYDLEGDSSDD